MSCLNELKIYNINNFDYSIVRYAKIQKRNKGNQSSKVRFYYKNLICAFDIETTYLKRINESIMYIWQIQIEDYTVVGRTWEDFKKFIEKINGQLYDNQRIVFFVHNLSYEWQFIKSVLKFESDNIFAMKTRKMLKCTYKCIEFRCSYLHSNMKLEDYTKKFGVENAKLSGIKFNYNKIRYPWTRLTKYEMQYCINDVKGLVQTIKKEMEIDGDNLYTFPLTSTGYVRRDTKHAMREVNKKYILKQQNVLYIYDMLEEAFRGGNTHANRFIVGDIIENVKSKDRSSSYPDVQCNHLFPVEPFKKEHSDINTLNRLVFKRKKPVLMRIAFFNLRLKDDKWGAPYLPKDKVRRLEKGIIDNGRILSMMYGETTITDVDYKILLEEYVFDDVAVLELYSSKYRKLPQPLINVIINYYVKKTELKDVEGQEIYYFKNKNKLNSVYGMCVQKYIREILTLIGLEIKMEKPDEEERKEQYEKYCKKAFLSYAWGVWTTCWARWELEKAIEKVHKTPDAIFLYCDTDSVKYVGDVDFTDYNKEKIQDSLKSGAYATDWKGITHYMGVFEGEHDIDKFVTLGAKKYCCQYGEELVTTIAGVNKKLGGIELSKYDGIKSFKSGFCFHMEMDGKYSGGLTATYNDHPLYMLKINGKQIEVSSNVTLLPSEYTLGLGKEYERLLKGIRLSEICS